MGIDRHRITLIAVSAFLFMGLLHYLLILTPAMSRRQGLAARAERRAADLLQMSALQRERETFQKKRIEAERRIRQKGISFTLLSFLEGMSKSVGVDKTIRYMRPFSLPHPQGGVISRGIEMRLDQVDMKALVAFLYKIEYSGKLLRIQRISIQRLPQGTALQVTLQVVSYSNT